MFFTISKQPDARLPNHSPMGSWCISYDVGWASVRNEDKTEWSKGIGDNKCLIHHDSQSENITFEYGILRSFPLWWDEDTLTLTNLLGSGKPVRADKRMVLFGDWLLTEHQDIHGDISTDTLSQHHVVAQIEHQLVKSSDALYAHRPRLFVSGGIDTVTLLALFKHLNLAFDLLDHEYFQYDPFTNLNITAIRQQHWAYGQIHHWAQESVTLASGAYGDEYMMRGPYTIALWCSWHNINLADMLTKTTGYHVGYFSLPKNLAVLRSAWDRRAEIQSQYPTYPDLVRQILDVNANDHQHWHLGRTLTWTPFLNPELTKLMLRLSVDDMLGQILNADVSRAVIQSLYPRCLTLLSQTKNQNTRKNINQLYTFQ